MLIMLSIPNTVVHVNEVKRQGGLDYWFNSGNRNIYIKTASDKTIG